VEALEIFLAQDPSRATVVGPNGWTLLHLAAWHGHPRLIEFLIRKGLEQQAFPVEIHAGSINRSTALHYAAWQGHRRIIEMLLDARADINQRMQDGDSPLHQAAFQHHHAAVEALLHKRADGAAKKEDGQSALHLAISRPPNTAGPTSPTSQRQFDTIKCLLQHKASCDAVDNRGWTPVHCAAMMVNHEALQLLADAKADLAATTNNGEAATHLILRRAMGVPDTEELIVQLLQTLRQNIGDSAINRPCSAGLTPLHLAAGRNLVQVTRQLLECSPDLEFAEANQWRAIHFAAWQPHESSTEVLQLLITAKVSLDARAKKCCPVRPDQRPGEYATPLLFATAMRNSDATRVLLQAKCDVEARNGDGETALHQAAMNNDLNTMTQLFDAGASLNARTNDQNTALHLACKHSAKDAAKVLIEKGADRAARNQAHITPLDLAKQAGFPGAFSMFD